MSTLLSHRSATEDSEAEDEELLEFLVAWKGERLVGLGSQIR